MQKMILLVIAALFSACTIVPEYDLEQYAWKSTAADVSSSSTATDVSSSSSVAVVSSSVFINSSSSILVIPPISFSVKPSNVIIDSRDSSLYKFVKIGDLDWLAENMRYLPYVSNVSEYSSTEKHYYVYGYDGNNDDEAINQNSYKKYGALYNWPAAQTACPVDWRLPNVDDWDNLQNTVGGSSAAGAALKADVGWPSNLGADSFGFSALPGGQFLDIDGFYYLTTEGFWWVNHAAADSAYFRAIGASSNLANFMENKSVGLSVRCVRGVL